MPAGSSDAALAPYPVDRSKLFVVERLDAVEEVDAARIARAIEYTRFPYAATPKTDTDDLNEEEGLLLGASSTNLSLTVYPGATHDFDDPSEKRQKVPGNRAAKADVMAHELRR